ncbi:hypothetical protein [Sorangium cellulosum]|uniref:hypothetical protein n=1 Tax=Sorangium cellulosum TaxID=56 RepID=UPI0012FF92CB|nr:hypothetical protein [Sorangium cellulosum]
MRAPAWIRVVIGALGAASFALGLACFLMPARLFGPDAYRTLARLPIGLLGAVTIGVALGTARALRNGNVDAVRTVAVTMLGAAILVPPVVTFNIGAFDNLTSGTRSFAVAALVVAFVSVPLLLSLRVLKRLYRAADPRASRP